MEEKIKLTTVTCELLDRMETFKSNIIDSMVVGDKDIIAGVIFYQNNLIKINPEVINDEVTNKINNYIDRLIIEKEYKTENINSSFNYGIMMCKMIMHTYNKIVKTRTKK